MESNQIWDKISKNYFASAKKDAFRDFAFERQVNSPSILSLCDTFGNALDLGCGDGRFTKELEGRYEHVFGLDCSAKMLHQAKLACPKTKFIQADLEKKFPKFSTKFDLIVCKLTLMFIHNIDNVASESYKALNSGGVMVISVTHPLKWALDLVAGRISASSYNGYLSSTQIQSAIAKDKSLKMAFINRTFETYINSFRKFGFLLDTILELGIPDFFVIKYPEYFSAQHRPIRLNLKFTKP